jgi:hypothetical protein
MCDMCVKCLDGVKLKAYIRAPLTLAPSDIHAVFPRSARPNSESYLHLSTQGRCPVHPEISIRGGNFGVVAEYPMVR